MISADDLVILGQIKKSRGVADEMELGLSIEDLDIEQGVFLFVDIDGIFVPFSIETYKLKNSKTAIFSLANLDRCCPTSYLIGRKAYLLKDDVDEDILADARGINALEGFEVIVAGKRIGKVTGIDSRSENVLLQVEGEGGRELLLPFHEDLIAGIDMDNSSLTLDIPEELLDLN